MTSLSVVRDVSVSCGQRGIFQLGGSDVFNMTGFCLGSKKCRKCNLNQNYLSTYHYLPTYKPLLVYLPLPTYLQTILNTKVSAAKEVESATNRLFHHSKWSSRTQNSKHEPNTFRTPTKNPSQGSRDFMDETVDPKIKLRFPFKLSTKCSSSLFFLI